MKHKKKKPKKIKYALIFLASGAFIIWRLNTSEFLKDNKRNLFAIEKDTAETSIEDSVAQKITPSPLCETLKSKYYQFETVKKNEQLDLRFENIHKRVGNEVYRLRRFFKDGDEGEIESFLVYQENSEGEAQIIEKSVHKKGVIFLNIEKTSGELLYREVGLNLTGGQFLHYINDHLSSAEGIFNNIDKKFIECRFQQV